MLLSCPDSLSGLFFALLGVYLFFTSFAAKLHFFLGVFFHFITGADTEEANRIGYETAMRWTKGKYQFFVCTHTDKGHIHNHIYYNSTTGRPGSGHPPWGRAMGGRTFRP